MSDSKKQIAKERKALQNRMDKGRHRIPNRRVDENLLLATWNIQNFGNTKPKRAIQYIADICERFDIIALQEVKTGLHGLKHLISLLPGNYRYLVSDPTGNSERFVFLYDKRTVVPTGLVCELGFNVSAKTKVGYQLHRMPYCVSFKAGRFDFVVVSTHILYGAGAPGRKEREIEIIKLAKTIAARSKKEHSVVFDRDFFVVGDFNIEKEGDQFFNALTENGFYMPRKMKNLKTNFLETKTYDKLAWVERPSFNFSGKCGALPLQDIVYQEFGKIDERKKRIGDHLPVWAEFHVNVLSQELDSVLAT